MLSSIPIFGAAPPAKPPPSPGLIWNWTRDDLHRALGSGNCDHLMEGLADLERACRDSLASQQPLMLAFEASTAAELAPLPQFVTTLLLMHPGCLSSARFAARVISATSPALPVGSYATAVRPLVVSCESIWRDAKRVDADNAQRWFFQAKALKDEESFWASIVALALAAADAILATGSLDSLANATGALAAAAEAAPRIERPAVPVLSRVADAISALRHRPRATAADAAFVALGYGVAVACGKRLRPVDAKSLDGAALDCLEAQWPGCTLDAKRAAAHFLAQSWSKQLLSAGQRHCAALGATLVASAQDRTGSAAFSATAAATVAMFEAASFPSAAEVDTSGLAECVASRVPELIVRSGDFAAAAAALERWYAMTLAPTLPGTLRELLRRASVRGSAALLRRALHEFSIGVGADRDASVVGGIRSAAGLLTRHASSSDAADVSREQRGEVAELARAALSRGAFHAFAPLAYLLWALYDMETADASHALAATVEAAGRHLSRGIAEAPLAALEVAGDSSRALAHAALVPKATPAVHRAVLDGALAVLASASRRGADADSLAGGCVAVLQWLADRPETSDVALGMTLPQLRLLAGVYRAGRGWVYDSDSAKAVDALFAEGSKLKASLRKRRDVRNAIAFDATTVARAVCGVLCMRRRFDARGVDGPVRAVERRVFDFCGDGAAVHAAFSRARGGELLLAIH